MILIFDSKGVSFGGWNSNFSEDNKFHEKLTYDLRGNITTLKRNGLNSNGWTSNHFVAGTYGRIDNLTYAYNTKNQLLSVNEASLPTRGFKTNPNATGDQYGYDGNGNLIFDKNKYITSIEYNYLNLPIKVVIDNPTDAVNSGSIEFIYDATGTKLRKTVKNKDGSVKETWDYVNGVEYKNQILQRVAHSEGAVVQNEFGQYQHEYVLRDHLGNVRVTFRDGVNRGLELEDPNGGPSVAGANPEYDDGIVTEADIVHINHTYPFGMAMEGNWNNAGSANNNKYLYNGKQWNDDFGMGWYDYGARFYDPSIARWASIDCKSAAYSSTSPYSYVQNDPINFMDIGGSYKFPAKYANLYRRFYEYLKNNAENDIMNSPRILDGLLKFSGGNLTKTVVQQAVKWGSGPTIEISDAPGGKSDALGHYDGNGVITINTKLVAQLQNATDAQIELLLTTVYKTVLHETVHYGDYLDGSRQDGGEPGDDFDAAVFFPINIYQNSDGTTGASVHPKFSTGEGISTIGAVTEWQQFMANKFPNILKELTPTAASSSTKSQGAGKTSTPVAPLPLIKPKPIPMPKPKPLPKPKPDTTRA